MVHTFAMASPGAPLPSMRPMTVWQILDGSVRMYRENFALFLAMTMLPTIPLAIAEVASLGLAWDAISSTAGRPPGEEQLFTFFLMMGLYLIFTFLHFGVAFPLSIGALTVAMSKRYLGEPVTLGSAFRPVFRNFWRYLLTSLLVSLIAIFAKSCTCGILFCFTWVWFLFTPCVMIIEGLGGTPAMGRSKELTAGHGWRIFGASCVMAIVDGLFKYLLPIGVGTWIEAQFESPGLQQVVQSSIQLLVTTVTEPLWAILAIMLYFDMRIRKEGYDLAMASHRLGGGSPLAA